MGTLGYTTLPTGGSGASANRFAYSNPATMPSVSGQTVTSFSIYGQASTGTGITIQLGLYSDSGDYPDVLLDYTDPFALTDTSPAWITESAQLGYTLEADTKYWIAFFDTNVHVGTTFTYHWDANGVDREHINMGDVATLVDPWAGSSAGTNNQQWGLYLTYSGTFETATFFSLSGIWAKDTNIFNSDSNIFEEQTDTFNSDSDIIPASAGTPTPLGYTAVGNNIAFTSREFAYANPYTIGFNVGAIASFSVYGNYWDISEAADIRLGLYSDSGNYPDALLDYTNIFTVNSTTPQWWTEDAQIGYILQANTKYWVAILHPTQEAAGQFRMFYDVNGIDREFIDMGTVNQFNDPWAGTSPGANDQQISMYLTFLSSSETATFNSDSLIIGIETSTFNSDSLIISTETTTFNSDSNIFDEDASTFNSDSLIIGAETTTFNSNSNIFDEEASTFNSDSLIISKETTTFTSNSFIIGTETVTFNSNSNIFDEETLTFNSDSNIFDEETLTFNSNSFIIGVETATFNSNSNISSGETSIFTSDSCISRETTITITSDARIIARGSIESEYNVPRRIQPNMRNTDTTPQTGGQDDGGFRIF